MKDVPKETTRHVISNDPLTRVTEVEFLDANGRTLEEYPAGSHFRTRVHYECGRKVRRPILTVSFANQENIQVISHYTSLDGFAIEELEGRGYLDFIIDPLWLKPGKYRCTITFTENNDINNILEWHDKAYTFMVGSDGHVHHGLVDARPKWELVKSK